MSVKVGMRPVGDGHPCFVTYEAGPTHNGIESAKELVTIAAETGADAVKFQIVDPDRLVSDRKQLFSYEILVDRESNRTETVSEPLYDLLMRRSLTPDEWRDVKSHADSLGLAFFATVTFDDELELVKELGCESVKIASADVNHFPFLRKAARTGLCLQIDTGNSTLGEIEAAIDVIRAEGNERIIIHHCPSGYPARLDGINLRVIQTLKAMFPYPVAYSDHSPGWDMDVAAIALGANLVEKTITKDRTIRSVEHIMSLEPQDCGAFIKMIRDLETALGTPRRIMSADERQKRNAARRSVWLPQGGRVDERLGDLEVEFRRPGYGVPPDVFEGLEDMVLAKDMAPDTMLSMSDLKKRG